jgi:hypothetical protein
MKLTYAVSLDDYCGVQKPFTTKPGSNTGFKGVLVFCALLAGLGVFTLVQGMGVSVGGFLIGLSVVSAVCAYAYDKRSIAEAKRKYELEIASGYQRVHCRDQRMFETNETGFTASCQCGSVTRPWSELISFSENVKLFVLNTKMGAQVLPKSAFAAPADVTEFRALVAAKLNQDRLPTSRHIEFACRPEDFRQGRLLHILEGGGWRAVAKQWATLAAVTGGAWVIWDSMNRRNPAILCGLVGGLLAGPILRMMKERRARYFGPLKIHFSEEGLHLQDRATQARSSWSQFIGYLENGKVLLLYYNPKLYRIIPKRALSGPGADFRKLAVMKLPPYDYRQPTVSQPTTLPDSAQA